MVCASSVLHGSDAFATLGHVVSLPERAITPAALGECDALIIRSKVRVDRALLEGSPVAFVATATAGTDHLDLSMLAERQIAWASAAGCNANSVAEYVMSALLTLARRAGCALAGKTLGVIGVGHVGRRVVELARALGLHPLLNDPPLYEHTGDERYRSLDEILPRCDIVSFHVPLTDSGSHPTRGLAGPAFFERLKPGAWFINAARGEVVQSEALLEARRRGRVGRLVLDVFEHEPVCVPDLVRSADLATPHIAGYSYEGKLNGTLQVYRAACHFYEVEPRWAGPTPAPPRVVDLAAGGRDDAAVLADAVRAAYDIEHDDRQLREVDPDQTPAFARHFERLRSSYPERREFPGTCIRLSQANPDLADTLRALGFSDPG